MPFGTTHTYIAHIREYPPGGYNLFPGSLVPLSECALRFLWIMFAKCKNTAWWLLLLSYRSFNPTIQVTTSKLNIYCTNFIFLSRSESKCTMNALLFISIPALLRQGYTRRLFWHRFTWPFCQYLGHYFINHHLAVLCKFLGDYWAF